jgi:hypothetical protein
VPEPFQRAELGDDERLRQLGEEVAEEADPEAHRAKATDAGGARLW